MENENFEIIIENVDVELEGLNLIEKVQKRKPGSAKGIIKITNDFHKSFSEEELEKAGWKKVVL